MSKVRLFTDLGDSNASSGGGGSAEAKYASFTPIHSLAYPTSNYPFATGAGIVLIPASTNWKSVTSSSSSVVSASGDNFVFGETGVYRMDVRIALNYTNSYSQPCYIRLEVGNDTDGWAFAQYLVFATDSGEYYPHATNFQHIYTVTDTATDQFRLQIQKLNAYYPQNLFTTKSYINVYRIGDLTTS